jgi:hypothetical protein
MNTHKKIEVPVHNPTSGLSLLPPQAHEDYEKKLRRRVEDRIRKDKEALYSAARVLNIR